VTECRQIDFLKRVCIFGSDLAKVKEFVDFIFNIGN